MRHLQCRLVAMQPLGYPLQVMDPSEMALVETAPQAAVVDERLDDIESIV